VEEDEHYCRPIRQRQRHDATVLAGVGRRATARRGGVFPIGAGRRANSDRLPVALPAFVGIRSGIRAAQALLFPTGIRGIALRDGSLQPCQPFGKQSCKLAGRSMLIFLLLLLFRSCDTDELNSELNFVAMLICNWYTFWA
jgi:hypothetical protein